MTDGLVRWTRGLALAAALIPVVAAGSLPQAPARIPDQAYQHEDTRQLVTLVKEAGALVAGKGETAFADLAVPGSRWRQAERYVFVLDRDGNMLVHPDGALEGKNQLDLVDINGRPIIKGLIAAATAVAGSPEGWYHYEWPVPGEILPRWKSTYVRLVQAPSGKSYVVGSGVYNDRMERAFVADTVEKAAAQVERLGAAAFPLFHDRTGPFIAKDEYVFVVASNGTDLVNPGFRNLEGRNLLDVKDTQGKLLIREMLDVVQTRGSGWVDYMWPKPGESVSTQKSAFVRKAKLGDEWVLVGSGVYLADAPRAVETSPKMTAAELMALVREGAAALGRDGEKAFPEFRRQGSKWLHDDTYFFVWTLDGTRVLHAADPSMEGRYAGDVEDAQGRPYGRMLLDAASAPAGEGWLHYMFPEPGNIFPAWKSVFVKRITFPSGKDYVVGSGIYNMQMDKAFITDLVERAAALVAAQGPKAFPLLRDRKGPFIFMDTYVFVDSPDGTELVNGAQPSMEGKNFTGVKDANGKLVAEEYIAAALKDGRGWVDYSWYRPGTNTLARKETYVRKVEHDGVVYIVGAGLYVDSRRLD